MEYYENSGDARALLSWVASTPPACAVAASGWLGQYYNGTTLTDPPGECRDDASINFDWGSGPPYPGMPTDQFAVRWTRTQTFTAGAWNFALGTDDGGRLYIDGTLVINDWADRGYPSPQPNVTRAMSAGAHVIKVEYYESGGSAKATFVMTAVSPPSTPTLAFSQLTNAFWTGAGSNVVYYRAAATAGTFTTTATSTDSTYGIAGYTFPVLGANWTSTAGTTGVNTYTWGGAPAAPGAQNVTATNGAGVTSANAPLVLTDDSTAPTAGTVTAPDGVSASTSASVAFTTGTDAGSGLGTRLLQRQVAPLTRYACGTYGAFATVTNGTNPTSPVVDTVSLGQCYRYQYVVSDNVGNVSTVVGAGIVKARKTYADTVNDTAGLVSYWRLGEVAASAFSADSFTATNATTLQAHAGETGATWTKHGVSSSDAVFFNGRLRKNDATLGALYYSSGVPPTANYRVEADVYVASTVSNDLVAVVGRLNPSVANGTFYASAYDVSSQKWTLYRVVNGDKLWLGQTNVQVLSAGATYRLALDMNGSTIRLLVNGVEQISVVDTSITAAGRAGVAVGFGPQAITTTTTTGMQLDNFSATSNAAAPALVDAKAVNTGTYVNGPTFGVTGAIANDASTAVQFDGVSDYGTVARQISDNFSIELWFQTTTGGISTGTNWYEGAGLVDGAVSGAAADFGVALRADGKVMAGVGTPDVTITSPLGYRDGAWHHVVFTRTMTTGALVLYVDGVSVATGTGSKVTLTAPPALTFGRIQSGTNSFAGSLDEIAVYNTVLTPATVAAHYGAS